jgi:hypothetical protein
MKKIDIITILGIISLIYWCTDIINNVFFIRSSLWSLWFSSVGILFTAIGLLTRNSFLINSLFCALFVVEAFWNIGFFSHFLFQKSFLGLTDYLFDGNYSAKDFIITSYHMLMVPFLLIAMIKEKIIYKTAWVGAAAYTAILCLLTYFFVGHQENVNCVHTLENCESILFFLSSIENPLRVTIGITLATFIIFIPTNYLLVKLAGRYGSEINLRP